MVTDLWHVSGKIDTRRHVYWHSISDGNIAPPIVALTSTIILLRLVEISPTLVQ